MSDGVKNPDSPLCIMAEGSTFYRLETMKEKVISYLKKYLNEEKNISFEIMHTDHATLIGAAIAALTIGPLGS